MNDIKNISHERAAEFRSAYNQPMYDRLSPDKANYLSVKLIAEETGELDDAMKDLWLANEEEDQIGVVSGITEVLDALADLEVVVSQAYHSLGVSAELREEINAEVHRSNMSKILILPKDSSPQSYVDEASRRYERLIHAELNKSLSSDTENAWILKNQEGKVVKPSTWSSPDIKSIVQKHL